MANEVTSEIKGQSLIVTFNRPERGNALNFDLATQLFTILKNATTDRGIRAVLLRGQGGNFMDGIDMAIYAGDVALGIERANQLIQPYHSAIRELQAMEKPVVAVVDGNVPGLVSVSCWPVILCWPRVIRNSTHVLPLMRKCQTVALRFSWRERLARRRPNEIIDARPNFRCRARA